MDRRQIKGAHAAEAMLVEQIDERLGGQQLRLTSMMVRPWAGQVPSKSCAIRTGTFNPEGDELAKTNGPSIGAFIAVGSRGQPVLTQASAEPVNGYGYMFLSMCVDASNNPGSR